MVYHAKTTQTSSGTYVRQYDENIVAPFPQVYVCLIELRIITKNSYLRYLGGIYAGEQRLIQDVFVLAIKRIKILYD